VPSSGLPMHRMLQSANRSYHLLALTMVRMLTHNSSKVPANRMWLQGALFDVEVYLPHPEPPETVRAPVGRCDTKSLVALWESTRNTKVLAPT